MTPTPPSTFRRARAATVALFFIAGLSLAVWVVSIPAVEHQTGVSHAVLGGLLLLLGLGSFIGMTAAGPLVDRFGSRRAAVIGATLLVIGVNLAGLADGPRLLGGALIVLGLGAGAIDVAMNDQAVIVERAYGRPIMSSFHAYFSVGGGAGALLGGGIQALGLSVNWSLGIGAIVTALPAAIAYPALLATRGGSETEAHTTAADASPGSVRRRTVTIVILACLAFLMMLSEGAASDWSALQAVEHLGQPSSAASLAYGSFAVAMTVGRFSADAVVHCFGPVKVVRVGSLLAAAGMLVVVLSPTYPLTLAGWSAFGIGLSGIVPQIFTAAGSLGGANQGILISRIVGAGYLGLLAGPAVIGWVSQGVGLTLALTLPVGCCIAGILLAGRAAPAAQAADRPLVNVTGKVN
ncbi:MFS transporter [Sinomonas sp. ASV322]|uniref:MFS transporter n=1 Tax=Sinomonas sp. ASV322 TaxID=3041920 RepID=UPI0027DBA1BD|nr:MFS transporter [Sinomonas sp. ASV322]MDQ4503384.1 MFS transporter [Sinomonas sp. ASV322]